MVQWLRFLTPNAGNLGLIHGQWTRFCMPQLRVCMPQLRHDAAKLKFFKREKTTTTNSKSITSKLPMPLDTPHLSQLGPSCCVRHYFSFNSFQNSLLLWHLLWVSSYISDHCFLSCFTVFLVCQLLKLLDPHSPQVGRCFLSHSFIFLHYPKQSWF